ncbi:AbrB family transcriptional regulator [Rhizobium sp. FY34]|uniref:AbrB family transcriptional regulator n=1 Tax=Rhizobium sp. FY34 TaxID=2562309 RepID=UPI0010C12816|nr:AbrB family transcriptional regulator [Rhizobium sp. FY34]
MSTLSRSPAISSFLIGACGAGLAALLGLPAPYLVGPAVAVTIVSLCGLRLAVPVLLRNTAFLAVGLSMGSGVTPDVLRAAQAWPLSFIALIAASVLLLSSAYGVLRRLFGYDTMTAVLAACPGHLSYVLSLAASTKSDLASVSIIQSVRVLALTLLVPVLVEVSGAIGEGHYTPPPAVGMLALVAMALPALGLGLLLQKVKVPAALLVGGMLVSSVAHLTGAVTGTIPLWVQVPVYITLGCLIGTRFSGVALADLRNAFAAGAVVTVLVCAISAAIALAVASLLDVPLGAALIAFAPGGLETMAAMAVILNADPAYVGTHHILRLIFLSILMPLVLSRAKRSGQ